MPNNNSMTSTTTITTARLIQASAFLGFTGVGLGALGAHALQKKLVERGVLESFKTAILYQLIHAVSLLGVAALSATTASSATSSSTLPAFSRLELAGTCMAVGSMLFSGSIYGLCFASELGISKKVLGPLTPLGGLIMLTGWGLLGFCINNNNNNNTLSSSSPSNYHEKQ